MAYNSSQTQEITFSCAVIVHKGVYDHLYGSANDVDSKVDQLRRRLPGSKLIRRYDDIIYSKVDVLRDGVEALNRGEKVNLDNLVK